MTDTNINAISIRKLYARNNAGLWFSISAQGSVEECDYFAVPARVRHAAPSGECLIGDDDIGQSVPMPMTDMVCSALARMAPKYHAAEKKLVSLAEALRASREETRVAEANVREKREDIFRLKAELAHADARARTNADDFGAGFAVGAILLGTFGLMLGAIIGAAGSDAEELPEELEENEDGKKVILVFLDKVAPSNDAVAA